MKLLTFPTWEVGPQHVTEGLWDDVIPWHSSGGDLSAGRGESQVWHQGELTLEAPGGLSQPTEPRLPSATWNKEAEVLGRGGKPAYWPAELRPVWLCKTRTGCSQVPS